jgi:hypothetical protein
MTYFDRFVVGSWMFVIGWYLGAIYVQDHTENTESPRMVENTRAVPGACTMAASGRGQRQRRLKYGQVNGLCILTTARMISMRQRLAILCLFFIPLFNSLAQSQSDTGNNDIQTYLKQCRIIGRVLRASERTRAGSEEPENAEYTVAGKGCDQLEKAVSTSDPEQISSAEAQLRPTFAKLGVPPTTATEQLQALEEATSGSSEMMLFYKLPDLAKRAFNAEKLEKAKDYSNRLLEMAPKYRENWNYGNAIFFGNFVLGRVAVREGNFSRASEYLLASGNTPGSPQLDSFGPNLTLAKELLEKGQSSIVLQYLSLCKRFWKMDNGRLDKWSATIRAGGVPDFSTNLNY